MGTTNQKYGPKVATHPSVGKPCPGKLPRAYYLRPYRAAALVKEVKGKVDKAYILERLTPLSEIKATPEILANLNALF